MLIKVCGLIEDVNLKQMVELDIDMIGLNFYEPSKRYLGLKSAHFVDMIPDEIETVGVFVDEAFEKVWNIVDDHMLDYVQLHGSESSEYCKKMQIHVKVIKFFGIDGSTPIDDIVKDYQFCDFLLFDTKTKEHGGSGKKFNWKILDTYTGTTPFLLSGGLGPDDCESIKGINHSSLIGVDINSRFEVEPGIKNIDKVTRFVEKLRS